MQHHPHTHQQTWRKSWGKAELKLRKRIFLRCKERITTNKTLKTTEGHRSLFVFCRRGQKRLLQQECGVQGHTDWRFPWVCGTFTATWDAEGSSFLTFNCCRASEEKHWLTNVEKKNKDFLWFADLGSVWGAALLTPKSANVSPELCQN